MCTICGFAGRHDFSVVERPAERLAGKFWRGPFEDAEKGVVRLIADIAAAASDGPWLSPVTGLSLAHAGEGLVYFAGVPAAGGAHPDGWDVVDLPAMRHASAWHAAEDGAVIGHYGRMLMWMADEGLRRDRTLVEQREEHPAGYDPATAPALRLMIPVG